MPLRRRVCGERRRRIGKAGCYKVQVRVDVEVKVEVEVKGEVKVEVKVEVNCARLKNRRPIQRRQYGTCEGKRAGETPALRVLRAAEGVASWGAALRSRTPRDLRMNRAVARFTSSAPSLTIGTLE